MELVVSKCKNWLIINSYEDDIHYKQLQISFKRKIRNHFFNPLVKKKIWDGSLTFIEKGRFIPIGLWYEAKKICEEYNIPLTIKGLDTVIDQTLKVEEIQEWTDEFFKDHEYKPRDYQVMAAFKILKYRRSISELATSAGKTLITFMVFAYLIQKGQMQRAVMIVPNTNLVIQGFQDFHDYNKGKLQLNIYQVYGGQNEVLTSNTNIIIGTYQSLCKKKKEFFDQVDTLCVDEVHGMATSVKNIVSKCTKADLRFGLSGTLKDDQTADYFTFQAFIGPKVFKITPDFLFKNKYATPVNIKIIKMDYASEEVKEKLYTIRENKSNGMDGGAIFNLEKQLVVDNKKRFNYITDFISKVSKNSLVLFINVKDKYGERIYDRLRELTSDKEIFYIDGSTKDDLREEYKKRLEEGTNKILVASFGTFSTGISVKNVHNIFFVESYKSEVIIKQSIGRGMRLHGTKEITNIIDFVDDFTYKKQKKSKNYLLKHSEERIGIYEQENFKFKVFDVKF